jgi:gliding motility associated protien GldN
MKHTLLIPAAIILIAAFTTNEANAQPRQRRSAPPAAQPTVSNEVPAIFANIPSRIDTVPETELQKPQRPNNFYGPGTNDSIIPIIYEHVRWDDALYLQKVWREIDLREKMNQTFRYDVADENGSQLFINILLRAVTTGGIQAFADDRFSDPLSKAEITDLTSGKLDTFAKYNPTRIDVIDSFIITRASFDPKTVTKLRIMEEWVFDREGSRLFCRILGIAALKTHYLPDGREREGSSVMFWVHYPDLRPVLANTRVYNPKNMGNGKMTWDELFESRMFSSYIIRSTIENASGKNIRASIKDPKLALLEGENIREKIFNYEQDQWSY